MDWDSSKRRFEEWMASRGVTLDSLTPLDGLDLMLRYLGDFCPGGCLTFVWTIVTYPGFGAEEFGFDITLYPQIGEGATFLFKTLVPSPGDGFSLVFKVGPGAVVGDLDQGEFEWHCTANQVADFRSAAGRSPAFQAWGRSTTADVLLVRHDQFFSDDHLFDRWGVRDPNRPVLAMTEEEWLASDDAAMMTEWLYQQCSGERTELGKLIARYLLACCRRIWKLLPREQSRNGVEVAERYLEGRATPSELGDACYRAEGAAFCIEYYDRHTEVKDAAAREAFIQYEAECKARVDLWMKEVEAIPPDEMRRMVRRRDGDPSISPHQLLLDAAYFADGAVTKALHPEWRGGFGYRIFLPAPLLREIVGNPFRPAPNRPIA